MPKIFLTGATGYIGGAVLARLLEHPKEHTFDITILVRSSEKASVFNRTFGEKHNLTAVVGSYSDLKLLRKLSADSDIVFACADSDDLHAAKAILGGLRDRSDTGVVPTLIHTTNARIPGVLSDDSDGMRSSPTIYNDLNIPQLETLSPEQPHRNVDLALVDADSKGYVKTYIVLPSTIYGFASGPLVKAGLQNPRSQQIPTLVNVSLKRGQGGMVGKGKNWWGNVHIDDENGEHTLYQVGEQISKVLSDMGRGNPSPTTFTEREIGLYFPGGTSLGSNSRCRAERGRNIGWRPSRKTQDMLSSIKAEVEASLSH
ncbi:hypothetical protein B0H19DRAFT_1188149 [Mycena capillaripes]|nr:hypothetical protein B0H19DRAFT_1188149 [Mycena capillaripes]